MTEVQLHTQVVNWLRLALPVTAVLQHAMNEGKRGWQSQRAVKTHGVHKGWPDLQILFQGKSIFIELKRAKPKGYLTKDQKACHTRLTMAGAVVTTCRSLEEVYDFLEQIMPLRATV